jgi:hypothetical protein
MLNNDNLKKKIVLTVLAVREFSSTTKAQSLGNMAGKMKMSEIEVRLQNFCDTFSKGLLPEGESVLLKELSTETRIKIFNPSLKFSERVDAIKPYLASPYKRAMVQQLPTAEKPVERLKAFTFEILGFSYMCRCICAVLPQTEGALIQIFNELSSIENLAVSDLREMSAKLDKLSSSLSVISVVRKAALKVWNTVDSIPFDEFHVHMSADEWEKLSFDRNEQKLLYLSDMQRLQSEEYLRNTSINEKIRDRKKLEKRMFETQTDLLKISKVTLEDCSEEIQLGSLPEGLFSKTEKEIKFSRKKYLAKVRLALLKEYREQGRAFDFSKSLASLRRIDEV